MRVKSRKSLCTFKIIYKVKYQPWKKYNYISIILVDFDDWLNERYQSKKKNQNQILLANTSKMVSLALANKK